MKKTNIKGCLMACVLAAASSLQVAKAQWTTIGSVISQTDTTKKVSIGTKSNTSDLYVYRNNSASSIGVRSGTGNAILNMDKGTLGANSAVAYKALGVTTWNTGLLGNNNYSIKNVLSGTIPLVISQTDKVGIGTSTPAAKLDIVGNIKITDGTQGIGKILKSDANGLASWGTLSGTDVVSTYAAADLKCPVVAGSVNIASGPQSVAVSGNYAYVAGLNNRLQVINISNPASPVVVSSGITGSATSIAVSGSYAYVVRQSTGDLDVINISNPASPAIVGSIVLGSSPQSIAVSGNYAFVVLDEDQFQVINITNPASPAIVGSAVTGNFFPFPNGVCVSGNYAYVINQNTEDLVVINISNPASPLVTGTASTSNNPSSVAVSGNYAFVVGNSNQMEVFNISNPASPTFVGSAITGNDPTSVNVSGIYAYVTNSASNTMQVFDISNPASPIVVGSLTTGSGPASVSVSGNYAYVANFGNSNMQVINLMCSGNFAVTVNPTTGQTTALPLQWNTIGYNIYNANSGNVGVGTSTPAFKLTTSFAGGVTNGIPTTGTSDPNAGFRLTTGAIALDMGTYNSGGSYIQNRLISNFATPYQLVLQPGGGGVSIGGYNAAFAQAPYTCTIYGTANCTSNSWSSSDVRYKKNIQTIGNALQSVMALRGVSYDFKTEEFASLNFEKEKQIGVIAQEVEKIFPELVKTDQEGFKAVNYDKIGPILIEAMKEQQAQIEILKSENAEMKSEINSMNDCVRSLCNTSQTTPDSKTTSTAVIESRLFQNQPNPFNRSTVIRYALSAAHNKGIIVIRDLNGNLVKSIAVNNTGKGQVTVTANEFAPGTYTYSLEIAGESIDTKLMVITK